MLMWLYNSCQGYVSEDDLNFILSLWLNYNRVSHLATHKSSLIIPESLHVLLLFLSMQHDVEMVEGRVISKHFNKQFIAG